MDFRPLAVEEKKALITALRGNNQNNEALIIGRDTSFVGSADEVPDQEVINAIRSVPCHY